MAVKSYSVDSVLFDISSASREVPFLKGAPLSEVGKKAPANVGLCNSHISNAQWMRTPQVTLNASLFFVDACINHRISFARTKIKDADQMVYGEYTAEGKNPVSFTCKKDDKNGRFVVSFRAGEDLHHPHHVFPIVTYAVAFDDQVRQYADIVLAQPKYDNALPFSDSVYYDFVKQYTNLKIDVEQDLTPETILEGWRAGAFEEMSKKVGGSGCTLFNGVNSRDQFDSELSFDDKLWEEYKAGKHRISYLWPTDLRAKIPSLDLLEGFVPTPQFFKIMNHLEINIKKALKKEEEGKTSAKDISDCVINEILYGPPGTGKSMMVHAAGAILGFPVLVTSVTEDTEGDRFTGMTKLVNGQFACIEPEFMKGWENGGILLIEEINLARPNLATGELNQAVEFPYILFKDEHKLVQRHPLAIVIGTMNPHVAGSQKLNASLSQRFTTKERVVAASEEDEKRMLREKGYPMQHVNCVYDVYRHIVDFLNEKNSTKKYTEELSIRHCKEALRHMSEGESARGAIMRTMYSALDIVDASVAEQVYDTCIGSMRELKSYPKD